MERVEQRVGRRPDPFAFYVDEDLSESLSALLRALGWDAINTSEARNRGFRDARQLAFAVHDGRVLLSANYKDHRLLYEAWRIWGAEFGLAAGAPHSGVLILPNPNALAPDDAATVIDRFVRGFAVNTLNNQLWHWRSSTGWLDLSAVH